MAELVLLKVQSQARILILSCIRIFLCLSLSFKRVRDIFVLELNSLGNGTTSVVKGAKPS